MTHGTKTQMDAGTALLQATIAKLVTLPVEGEKVSLFFPFGITKIEASVGLKDYTFHLLVEGPTSGQPRELAAPGAG